MGAVIAFTGRGTAATVPTVMIMLMVAVSCATWVLLARGHRLTRPESAALILLYGLALPLLV